MEDPISVIIMLKTGQKVGFKAFGVERVGGGYSFTSYPEERGFKTLRVIKDDAIATISITAPEPMLKDLEAPVAAQSASAPYIDPQRSAPKTTLSAFNRLRTEDGSNKTVALVDREAPPGMGRPKALVNTYDESGREKPVPVDAAMI